MKRKELTNDTRPLVSLSKLRHHNDFKFKKPSWVSVVYTNISQRFNPLIAKLFDLNFHPLEVVSR